jgi:ATP-binding cassette subfamily F protein 3
MDEPTIHLDVPSVDALIGALNDFEGALCFVSHDVHFIRSVAERVVRIDPGVVDDYLGDWDYYCWRRASGEAPAEGAPKTVSRDQRAPLPDSGAGRTSLRLERRLAAEARAALSRRLRPLREKTQRLEAEIAELEREKGGIEADLANPETYIGTAGVDVAALHRRHAEVARALAVASDDWLETETAIEETEQAGEDGSDGDAL